MRRASRVVAVVMGAVAAFVLASTLRSTDAAVHAGEARPHAAPTRVVAVLGDSFMAGTGARSPRTGMAQLLADHFDRRLDNFAQGGTGYLNPGTKKGRRPIPHWVDAVVAAEPDTVLVAAGYNDYRYVRDGHATIAEVGAAARRTFRALVRRTGVPVAVVGPFWKNDHPWRIPVQVDRAIRRAAERVGVPFIDPIADGWITGSAKDGTGNAARFIGPDHTHPTPAGHRYFARRIAEALVALASR